MRAASESMAFKYTFHIQYYTGSVPVHLVFFSDPVAVDILSWDKHPYTRMHYIWYIVKDVHILKQHVHMCEWPCPNTMDT